MQNMNIIDSAHFSAAIASAMTGLVESHAVLLRQLLKTALTLPRPVRYVLSDDHRMEPVARDLAARLRADGFNARGFYSALPDQTYYAVDIHP